MVVLLGSLDRGVTRSWTNANWTPARMEPTAMSVDISMNLSSDCMCVLCCVYRTWSMTMAATVILGTRARTAKMISTSVTLSHVSMAPLARLNCFLAIKERN